MYNKLYNYFYDLYSPVSSFFLCVCVCVHFWNERATVDKQYVALPDPTWETTNSGGLFRSGLLCPCKLNFVCVCVCVPSQVVPPRGWRWATSKDG